MIVLTICGGAPAEQPYIVISQIATAYYFLHFLVILPIISQIEVPKPLPFSITEAVLGKDDDVPGGTDGGGDAPGKVAKQIPPAGAAPEPAE